MDWCDTCQKEKFTKLFRQLEILFVRIFKETCYVNIIYLCKEKKNYLRFEIYFGLEEEKKL